MVYSQTRKSTTNAEAINLGLKKRYQYLLKYSESKKNVPLLTFMGA